jgi:hypothetical protein
MPNDFLEQLAEIEVPPPPPSFDRQLHNRVNRSLIIVQVVELVLGAFPAAVLEFGRAMLAFGRFTLAGKYEFTKRTKNNQ